MAEFRVEWLLGAANGGEPEEKNSRPAPASEPRDE